MASFYGGGAGGASGHASTQYLPKVSENGTWLLWDPDTNTYIDTGKPAVGKNGLIIADELPPENATYKPLVVLPDGETALIPQIKDDQVSEVDTWSSKKISQMGVGGGLTPQQLEAFNNVTNASGEHAEPASMLLSTDKGTTWAKSKDYKYYPSGTFNFGQLDGIFVWHNEYEPEYFSYVIYNLAIENFSMNATTPDTTYTLFINGEQIIFYPVALEGYSTYYVPFLPPEGIEVTYEYLVEQLPKYKYQSLDLTGDSPMLDLYINSTEDLGETIHVDNFIINIPDSAVVPMNPWIYQKPDSVSLGQENLTPTSLSLNMGYMNSVGYSSIGVGYGLTVGNYSLGINANAYNNSLALGNCVASNGSTANGKQNIVFGMGSAFGRWNHAFGSHSHAYGRNCKAHGSYSFAQGDGALAYGDWSRSEGQNTVAVGQFSNARGQQTVSTRRNQEVFGRFNVPEASTKNITSENFSFWWTSGQNLVFPKYITITEIVSLKRYEWTNDILTYTYTPNDYTYNEATQTIVLNEAIPNKQRIVVSVKGYTGNSNSDYMQIAGNGTNDGNRSNAYTLDWNGNAWFSGDVYVGSTSKKNKDAGSQKLVKQNELQAALDTIQKLKNAIIALGGTIE